MPMRDQRTLILGCGALAREILAVIAINRLDHLTLRCLPANLHNHPEKIPDAVRQAVRQSRADFDRIFVAYADCGTGGLLDKVLSEEGVERLPGAHCYAFFSGIADFEARTGTDMRAFFLTDFLVRQFDTLVIEGLGLDRHPELRDDYFGNYEKIVYLAQTRDSRLLAQAEVAAGKLGLAFEVRYTGYGELEPWLKATSLKNVAV